MFKLFEKVFVKVGDAIGRRTIKEGIIAGVVYFGLDHVTTIGVRLLGNVLDKSRHKLIRLNDKLITLVKNDKHVKEKLTENVEEPEVVKAEVVEPKTKKRK